jgi:hypothetical protein
MRVRGDGCDDSRRWRWASQNPDETWQHNRKDGSSDGEYSTEADRLSRRHTLDFLRGLAIAGGRSMRGLPGGFARF